MLAANLALVGWWTWFQVTQAGELQTAGEFLARGDVDGAARALGATDAKTLPDVASTRRRMFLSEGLAFTVVLLLGGATVVVLLRREGKLRADHDRFLAGATHELKTPLATIQLLLESLRDDRLPESKRARYLQSGLIEAHRLENGLTNLLTAAGLRGRTPRRSARIDGDLADDVRRAMSLLQPRAEAAGVQLVARDLQPIAVSRDPEAMQLILHNLLDNAVKYSSQGATVVVQLRSEANAAVLSVVDQGLGMDRDTLANAFVPFWRGRDSGTGGTGLGLFLVRELVHSHGGTVAARSDGPGQGSELRVTLPRRAPTQTVHDKVAAPARGSA
ncbi:MAG: HAMP domain-containing sensor histidine kinase [Planctomycetota bacterium]